MRTAKTENKTNARPAEPLTLETAKFHIIRANQYGFDMVINGVTLYGLDIRDGKNGNPFISFPARKGSDGKYYRHCYFAADQDLVNAIVEVVEGMLDG